MDLRKRGSRCLLALTFLSAGLACGGAIASNPGENDAGFAGSKVFELGHGDGGGSGVPSSVGGNGGDPVVEGPCPVGIPSGTACAIEGLFCPYAFAEPCGASFRCVGGAWKWEGDNCSPKPVAFCPSERPVVGSRCEVGDHLCEFIDNYCGLTPNAKSTYSCEANVWKVTHGQFAACSSPTLCPPKPPTRGTECQDIDASTPFCFYPCNDFRYSATAYCVGRRWTVSTSTCTSDAGPGSPDAPSIDGAPVKPPPDVPEAGSDAQPIDDGPSDLF